jgi:hypothetical protein
MEVVERPKVALLRNDQVEEMLGEKESLTKKLNHPGIQDKGTVAEQLRRLDHQLETQRPKAYSSTEIDAAVKREEQLRSEFTDGMLSQEEMRKNPSGAVGRLLAWERKNIAKVEEWQNIRRRLYVGSDDPDIASIERYRPVTSTMPMHDTQIQGKIMFMPPPDVGQAAVFSDEQIEMLRSLDPELADKIAMLTNVQRQEVKEVLSKAQMDGQKGVEIREAKKKKKVLSPEHLAKLKAGREKKKVA